MLNEVTKNKVQSFYRIIISVNVLYASLTIANLFLPTTACKQGSVFCFERKLPYLLQLQEHWYLLLTPCLDYMGIENDLCVLRFFTFFKTEIFAWLTISKKVFAQKTLILQLLYTFGPKGTPCIQKSFWSLNP